MYNVIHPDGDASKTKNHCQNDLKHFGTRKSSKDNIYDIILYDKLHYTHLTTYVPPTRTIALFIANAFNTLTFVSFKKLISIQMPSNLMNNKKNL